MTAIVPADAQTLALAALGRVACTVAHEIRNVLGGIELHAALLAEECASSSDLAPISSRLLSGVKQLNAVATNLLAVTRRAAPERLSLDVGNLVTETIESASLAIRGSGVRLRTKTGTEKATVFADPERLRQALLNVVLNAVQAMPNGGALTIATRLTRGHIEISVTDTGVGMDRATLRRAFEPFFSTRANGTGLGLAVVRDVVQSHGGHVAIASRQKKGTAVRLILPLAARPCTERIAQGFLQPALASGGIR